MTRDAPCGWMHSDKDLPHRVVANSKHDCNLLACNSVFRRDVYSAGNGPLKGGARLRGEERIPPRSHAADANIRGPDGIVFNYCLLSGAMLRRSVLRIVPPGEMLRE